MATSSIHISTGANGFFAHNSREEPTSNSIFNDEENYCSHSKNEAFEIYRNELKVRSENYTKRTGQKLQKNTITHLSSILNLNKEHTPEDLKKVCEHLEKKFDTKVIQFSIHRDEGHHLNDATDEVRKQHALLNEDSKIKNYHAHIEFLGLDSQGKSIKRNLHKKELIELQTEVAEILGMKRGRNFNQEFKDFKQGKRDTMPTKAKRFDTYEYKAHKENEAKAVLAKQKDLKAEVAELRAELKANNATRAEYAKLEQSMRELQERTRAKDLTIEELQKTLSEAREEILNLKSTVDTKNRDKEVLEQYKSDLKALSVDLKLSARNYGDVIPAVREYINSLSTKPKSEATKQPEDDWRSKIGDLDLDLNAQREETKQMLKQMQNQSSETQREDEETKNSNIRKNRN